LHLHNELRGVLDALLLALAAELGIRVDDGGNALCRIEAGNLHDVLAGGVGNLGPTCAVSSGHESAGLDRDVHPLRMGRHVVDVSVVARVKGAEMLIQAIEPGENVNMRPIVREWSE
jgi:hypothetical protein